MSRYRIRTGSDVTETPSDDIDPQEEADEEPHQEQRHGRSHQCAQPGADPGTDQVDRHHQHSGASDIPSGQARTGTIAHGVNDFWSTRTAAVGGPLGYRDGR